MVSFYYGLFLKISSKKWNYKNKFKALDVYSQVINKRWTWGHASFITLSAALGNFFPIHEHRWSRNILLILKQDISLTSTWAHQCGEEFKWPRTESQLHLNLHGWPWKNVLIYLKFSLLIFRMGTIIVSTLTGGTDLNMVVFVKCFTHSEQPTNTSYLQLVPS
jgi:hypothetical protein